MPALLLALLLLAPSSEAPGRPSGDEIRPPWVLVLSDGRRLPLREEPKWVFGRASVRDAAGRLLELEWKQVDHEATRKANPRSAASEPDGLPRVWDEEALRALRGRRLNVVDNGGAAPELAQSAPGEAGALSEADWRARASALSERIRRLEAELAYLERARGSWEAFALGTGGDYDAAAASELGEIRRARQARQDALSEAKSDWARLQEEARRSRVPPGWLR